MRYRFKAQNELQPIYLSTPITILTNWVRWTRAHNRRPVESSAVAWHSGIGTMCQVSAAEYKRRQKGPLPLTTAPITADFS